MITIYLIIGLPGSGKTHYVNNTPHDLPFIDDIFDINQLPESGDFIIADVNFCDASILQKAKELLTVKYGNPIFKEVCFENDPVKARANVARRNDGRNVEGTIARFEKIYNPPADALKIFA